MAQSYQAFEHADANDMSQEALAILIDSCGERGVRQ